MKNILKAVSKYIGIDLSSDQLEFIISSQNLDFDLENMDISYESIFLKIMNSISVHIIGEEWKVRSFLPPEIYLRQATKIRQAAKDQGFKLSW